MRRRMTTLGATRGRLAEHGLSVRANVGPILTGRRRIGVCTGKRGFASC